MISDWFYKGLWQLERAFKRVKCFFTGHNARMGIAMKFLRSLLDIQITFSAAELFLFVAWVVYLVVKK